MLSLTTADAPEYTPPEEDDEDFASLCATYLPDTTPPF